MADYIKRETVVNHLNDCMDTLWKPEIVALKCFVEGLPAADVAPVRHGRWITPHWHNSDYCYNCSKCGGEAMHREYQWARNGIYPICPNCGAKMDITEQDAASDKQPRASIPWEAD